MQDELLALIKLQELDLQVDELNEQAQSVAPLIQKKNQSIEDLKNQLKTAKERSTSFQVKKKELELEAESQEKLVQKHQAELNSLKSNDAYKAMLGEIQASKQAVVKIEDEILVVMESIDKAEKEFKESERKFKSDEGTVKAAIQELEQKKSSIAAEASKKKEERDAYAKTIPANLLTQYEIIREKSGGLAIVPINVNSCGGCRMSLTASKMTDIMKSKNVVICESCMRILYKPADPTAVTPSAPSPSTPAPVSS
jgi:predicted  nucleic acid-binding Zn-ribbon protein